MKRRHLTPEAAILTPEELSEITQSDANAELSDGKGGRAAKNVPSVVLGRLPRYYRFLRSLVTNDIVRVSSNKLAELMSLTPSQIRQDLAYFGGFGQQGYGYNVRALFSAISDIMGVGDQFTAVLIGEGIYADAVAELPLFTRRGVRLRARFDINNAGDTYLPGSFDEDDPTPHCYSLGSLAAFAAEQPIDLAILALPDEMCESVARMAIKYGVRGIWNLTWRELPPKLFGEDVKVQNFCIGDSLMALCCHLKRAKENEEASAPAAPDETES